jgi:hypothetical protein
LITEGVGTDFNDEFAAQLMWAVRTTEYRQKDDKQNQDNIT